MPRKHLKQALDWSHRHWTIRPLWLRRFRRRHRWLLRVLVIFPLLVLALLITIAHSPVTRFLVVRALERGLNLDIDAESVYVALDGDLVIDRARFRIPGIQGPAGQFLNVARIEAPVDWWSTISGTPKVRLVTMTEPVVIVSQSIDDHTLNLERFTPPPSSGVEGLIPRIEVSHAGIEIGEHTGATYKPLRRVQMDGWFRPSTTDKGGFAFGLHEYSLRARRPDGPKEPGFVVTGTRAQGLITVKVENFTLDDFPASSVPTPIRTQFESLDLRGDVPRAIFAYAPDTGITARLVMQDVAMNLPLEPDSNFVGVAQGVQGPLPQYARMRDVSGDITFARDNIYAQVDGQLEDLPYHVNLRYDGLTPESPFTLDFISRDFRVEKSPSLLPYAPPRVREWLGMFCGPTALVTTQVSVKRGPPVNGVPAEPRVAGTLTLKEGTAAYARFPYEFRDMTGTFEFDNDQVKIITVKGKSASGATIDAHGLVAPLDESAEVTVDVQVRGAPIDHAMEEAFGPTRRHVLAALFNQAKHQELLDGALVQSSEQALQVSADLARCTKELAQAPTPELQDKVRDLTRLVARPVFDFGGTADVDIHVHSPRGAGTNYETAIDIRIPRAGLVPEKFPLPVQASGVTVRIDNDKGRLTGGEFRALGGGQATVQATFRVPAHDEPDTAPEISIRASDLPLSPLIIHALPGPDASSSVKRILRALNISGLGQGTVHIAGRGGSTDLGFDAAFSIADAAADPQPIQDAGAFHIGSIRGTLTASEETLDVSLQGEALVDDDAAGRTEAAKGPVSATIHSDFGTTQNQAPTTYTVNASCPGLSLTAPCETLVNAIAPNAASEMLSLRRTFEPTGAGDIATTVSDAGRGPRVTVNLKPVSDLSIRMYDGDVTLAAAQGAITVTSDGAMSVRCDDVQGQLRFDGEAAGAARLHGLYPGPAPDQLHTTLTGLPVESGLVHAILATKLSTQSLSTVDDLHPTGIIDADLTVVPETSSEHSLPPPRAIAAIEPRSLSFQVGDQAVAFPSMSGRVDIDGSLGYIRALSAKAQTWSVTAEGAWETGAEAGFTLRTQLSGSAQSLSPDLAASLPAGLRSVFEEISLRIDGPMTLDDATLALCRGNDPAADWTRFSGSLAFSGASMETGASISELKGRLDSNYQHDAGQANANYKLAVDAESFRIGGIALGNGRAVILSGTGPGDLSMPEASGECYGGRFAASASVYGDGHGGHSFLADTRLSGVRFSPLIADLSAAVQKEPAPEAQDETSKRRRDDFSRGLMNAEVTLGGTVGKPQTRRGRGTVLIRGGRVLNIPLATRLIEVSNLALPGNAELDTARVGFYLEGGLITFEDLALISSSVEIFGFGTMTWPGQVLDLRFGSRSARPIPVLSKLVQGIREQLLTTTVTGKLGQQQIKVQQLPGRMIGRAVGAHESERARRLNDLESRAAPIQPRPGALPAPAVPPTVGQDPHGS